MIEGLYSINVPNESDVNSVVYCPICDCQRSVNHVGFNWWYCFVCETVFGAEFLFDGCYIAFDRDLLICKHCNYYSYCLKKYSLIVGSD